MQAVKRSYRGNVQTCFEIKQNKKNSKFEILKSNLRA
jgi:hypothetical protein